MTPPPQMARFFTLYPYFLKNLSVVMYRKFRNVPIFKDFPLISPYFLDFSVGRCAVDRLYCYNPVSYGELY